MDKLLAKREASENVTVHEAFEDNLFDYTTFLGEWYRDLASLVLANHMFTFSQSKGCVGNRYEVSIRKSDIPEHKPIRFDVIKNN